MSISSNRSGLQTCDVLIFNLIIIALLNLTQLLYLENMFFHSNRISLWIKVIGSKLLWRSWWNLNCSPLPPPPHYPLLEGIFLHFAWRRTIVLKHVGVYLHGYYTPGSGPQKLPCSHKILFRKGDNAAETSLSKPHLHQPCVKVSAPISRDASLFLREMIYRFGFQ